MKIKCVSQIKQSKRRGKTTLFGTRKTYVISQGPAAPRPH